MSLFLSVLLLMCFLIPNPRKILAIDDFWVQVTPRRISSIAVYQLSFSLKKKVMVGQWIAIDFPPGTTIYPPIPEKDPEKTQRLNQLFENISISMKGGQQTVSITKDGFLRLIFNVSILFDSANPLMKIVIPAKCGFVNPPKEGIYVFRIATESEPAVVESESFQIVESRLSTPVVSIYPSQISVPASYKVEFNLGKGGSLKRNQDYIQLSFPAETKILKHPSEIRKEMVTINNIPLGFPPEGVGRVLKLLCPIDLLDASKVVVKIDSGAGIQNPPKEGQYRLMVSTSTDTTWEKSESYSVWVNEPVKPRVLSVQSIVIRPNIAFEMATFLIEIEFGDKKILTDGDWIQVEFSFQEKPILYPVSEQLTQRFVVIIPEIENPSPGSYHCLVKTNKEPKGIISDKFAILPPKLKTNIDLLGGTIGNDNWYIIPPSIFFACSDPQAKIEYWFDNFTDRREYQGAILLSLGQYETTIYYFSSQGDDREEIQSLLIKVDTIPPNLTISVLQNPLKSPVMIGGKIETNARLFIDQVEIDIDPQGNFSTSIIPKAIGAYSHMMSVIDSAGNVTKQTIKYWFGCRLLFQIGKKQVHANDEVENLAIPPFISQGFTLIPFRYLGEKLHASINFTIDQKTKQVKTIHYQTDTTQITLTINQAIALVNHQETRLDVPPQIVQGYTVVPLRFIAEALHCRIEWDSSTQRIKLEYPIL